LVADIEHIGLVGFAFEQAVSMFNYIQRLQAIEGDDVLQLTLRQQVRSDDLPTPQVEPLIAAPRNKVGLVDYFWFETETVVGAGLGKISEGDTITLTGHSLGGHLATFALCLFPDLFDQAVTFNASGFDPTTAEELGLWSHQLTDEFLSELFGPLLTKPYASTFGSLANRLHVLESEDTAPGNDRSLVSSILTGGVPNAETFVCKRGRC